MTKKSLGIRTPGKKSEKCWLLGTGFELFEDLNSSILLFIN